MDLAGKNIHFMGAGGIGVSALAMLAKQAGANVTGCDRSENQQTDFLRRNGVMVYQGHHPSHVENADLLVYTSAIPESHPERRAAAKQEKRGRFLARFLDDREAWGVSGTHGKTTTSWLISRILMAAGSDPTVFIGGVVKELAGGNFRLGRGPFVAELDESDASFLLPRLDLAVITNIESDHLNHYGHVQALLDAFQTYADGVARHGLLVAGIDSPPARDIYLRHPGRKISFSLRPDDDQADVRALDLKPEPDGGSSFAILFRGNKLAPFRLSLPGRHNVQNALAAFAAAAGRGISELAARAALADAPGVERRMEVLGRLANGAVVYSDYAHHPTEVAAALATARERHPDGFLAVFQPHLYSRTRDYADDFARVLAGAPELLLVDIYPAREDPIPGITGDFLMQKIRALKPGAHGPVGVADLPARVRELAARTGAVLLMGAGDIDAAARSLPVAHQGDKV